MDKKNMNTIYLQLLFVFAVIPSTAPLLNKVYKFSFESSILIAVLFAIVAGLAVLLIRK